MAYNLQADSLDYPDIEEVLERSKWEWLGRQDVHDIFTFHVNATISLDPLNELEEGLYMYNTWTALDTHEWVPFNDGLIIHMKQTTEVHQPMSYTVVHLVLDPIDEGVRSTYERRVYTPQSDFEEFVLVHYRFLNIANDEDSEDSGIDVENPPSDDGGDDSSDDGGDDGDDDSSDDGDDDSSDDGDDDAGGNDGGNLEEEDIGENDNDEDAYAGENADDAVYSDHEDAPPLPLCNGHVVMKPMDEKIPGLEAEKHTSQILKRFTPDFQWDDKLHKHIERLWINVEDNDGEKILHYEYIDEDHTLNFTVPIFERLPPQYFVPMVSDRWLGSQTVLPVSFRHLILPKKYQPPTELLDLQPLSVTALRNPNYERLYQDCKHFNPVQTQVLTVLYKTNENVLVAAPMGSGKTIFAEFAMLRNNQEGPDAMMRVVCIAPLEAIAKEQFHIWNRKFVKGLSLQVVVIIGEAALDLKLLEKVQIIISTPEKWDTHSCRCKLRNYAQLVSLFIVDKLHLIGGQGSPVLEVIISRVRYISSQADKKIRVVALSTFFANAKDLGEWIGASSHDLISFPPGVHPVPLKIHIQGLNFIARMQVMTKPTYTTIVQHTENKKLAIVFVLTCKHVHLTAVDLMVYSHMDNSQSPDFLLGRLDVLEPFVSQIRKETLKETLCHGVGFLHEGLSSLDHEIVTQLFEAGRFQVCVMSSSLCWGTALTAHLVVVMGTQYYDGRENSHLDDLFSDLLQMIGRASRPLLGKAGNCVIFCHTPRKEYYKKFLYEAFPVKSHVQHILHDNFNAKVVAGVIENKQDTVDYLTWNFMYRRLPQNPNHYSLQGVSHMDLSDHLSKLVENILSDREAIKCIEIEDEMEPSPLNLGMIASYYYISYTTIERFSSLLSSKAKMKGLREILTVASEYDMIPITPGEEDLVRRLINHLRFSFENPKCTDLHGERDYEDNAETKPSFSIESADLDNADVVEPDNEPPQAIGDPTDEVTNEKKG